MDIHGGFCTLTFSVGSLGSPSPAKLYGMILNWNSLPRGRFFTVYEVPVTGAALALSNGHKNSTFMHKNRTIQALCSKTTVTNSETLNE